ncbi:MAG TPA: OmpA family protein [Bacteroidia bacterium]|jgi:outer membrane protein OmpA-like peptidoglycan-associated protein/tetratricopeptide (TPR) repeat protein|nr:OmpA family protein [Bacteroidia bacterium]
MITVKKIVGSFIFIVAFVFLAHAQSVPFDKAHFANQKDQLKEAKKAYDDGKDAFDIGKKEYDFLLEQYVAIHKYYPVSRHDYAHSGDIYFQQALPLLEKAQAFNPNNDQLNFMLGFIYFVFEPRSEKALKCLETAYKLNPTANEPDDVYALAWANQLNLKWDDAIKYYALTQSYVNTKSKDNLPFAEEVAKKIGECKSGRELMAHPVRTFVDNLGSSINTAYPEYSAFINADESVVIFTSCRDNSTGGKKDPDNGGYYEDIYLSNKLNGQWSPAQNMGPTINTEDHDATAGLSADGTTMFIYRFKEKDGGDLYVSHLLGAAWSKPEHMGKNVNSKAHETSVSISYDGKQLYFISNREGGVGDGDLYVCQADAKGNWAAAQNVGPSLNTKYSEEGVFMHPDGKTIYFSSKGYNTMGGYDIFKSTFENGKWSAPENLGYPINGPEDDVFFVISGSGYHGYFASAKQGGYGKTDIYRITFLGPEKAPTLMNEDNLLASVAAPISDYKAEKIVSKGPKMTMLKGVISDEQTKIPLEAQIELIDNEKNELLATFSSNSATGKYLVSLPSGKNYGIAVKKDGYLFHSENFDLPATADYQEVEKNIELKKIDVGKSIVLRNIFFDFDKATIRPESANELDRLIKLLVDNPTLRIELGSHTDSKGSDDYNMKLSQQRSQSVVNYLITKGIATARLEAKGYGETVPIATNDTDDGRQQNRRTEFKILSK